MKSLSLNIRVFTILITLFNLVSMEILAQENQSADKRAIKQIIQSVKTGWEQADGTPFRKHFLDFKEARYYESGGQNEGLEDLIVHHVEPEGEALALNLEFNNIRITLEGSSGWAIFDTDVKATINKTGRKIHNKGHQTMIFRKTGGEWKVLHTHSSSRPVKKETGS